jgi:exopolysaccharide production protein ExoY
MIFSVKKAKSCQHVKSERRETGLARAALRESMAKPRGRGRGGREGHLSLRSLGGPWKRAFDVVMAVVAFVVLMPLIFLTAILVRLFAAEPVIVCEQLIGLGGRTFVGYTFRIPVAAESSSRWAECFAEVMRRSGLDQLPRFFNVIRGDMSLIGPRPRAVAERWNHFARAPECLLARPGLISIGQSCRATCSDQRTEIALDRYYVRNWSIRLDFALLSKSIFSTRGEGTA